MLNASETYYAQNYAGIISLGLLNYVYSINYQCDCLCILCIYIYIYIVSHKQLQIFTGYTIFKYFARNIVFHLTITVQLLLP